MRFRYDGHHTDPFLSTPMLHSNFPKWDRAPFCRMNIVAATRKQARIPLAARVTPRSNPGRRRETIMFRSKVMLATLLGACVLFVSVAVAASASDHQPEGTGTAIRTTLQPDLTFKSTLSPEFFPATAFHQKTCRCSCGYPCNQDDDCGPGGSCDQFISCCDRSPTSQSVLQAAGRSTHNGEVTVAVMSVKCK